MLYLVGVLYVAIVTAAVIIGTNLESFFDDKPEESEGHSKTRYDNAE